MYPYRVNSTNASSLLDIPLDVLSDRGRHIPPCSFLVATVFVIVVSARSRQGLTSLFAAIYNK
jgi:hypothetical protein